MIDAFGIARDLGADDAGRVAVIARAVNATDRVPTEQFDLERAGRGAIMRTRRMTKVLAN